MFQIIEPIKRIFNKKKYFFKVMMCVRDDRVIARPGHEQNPAMALVGSTKFEVVTAVLLRVQVRDATLYRWARMPSKRRGLLVRRYSGASNTIRIFRLAVTKFAPEEI
jgi:hypothetical protein